MLVKKNDADINASISGKNDTLNELVSNRKTSNPFVDYKTLKAQGINVAVSLREMIDRVENEPPIKTIYSGIIENSMGFVFGPSKSAKTTFCENLGLSIASGKKEFLGNPIDIENKKVLFISLEEDYKPRTYRNKRQKIALAKELGNDDWLDNYQVINEHMPQNVSNDSEWQFMSDLIVDVNPGIVFIDSLTRLYQGVIEDSNTSKLVMQRLKQLPRVTTVIIHHTPKQMGKPLTQDSLAGSRILAQEGEFMIGLNKTFDGKGRYIKDVSFRYQRENTETVKLFELDDNQWVRVIRECDETELLFAFDGRRDDTNKMALMEFITSNVKEGNLIVTSELEKSLVSSNKMSKQTLYSQLNSLQSERKIEKVERGVYKLVA